MELRDKLVTKRKRKDKETLEWEKLHRELDKIIKEVEQLEEQTKKRTTDEDEAG